MWEDNVGISIDHEFVRVRGEESVESGNTCPGVVFVFLFLRVNIAVIVSMYNGCHGGVRGVMWSDMLERKILYRKGSG